MPSSADTKTLTITNIRWAGFRETLNHGLLLNDVGLIEIRKDNALSVTSIKFWRHSKAYASRYNTINGISRYYTPWADWGDGATFTFEDAVESFLVF